MAEGTEWLGRGANVLLFGPPGAGKSHLVCALGHALTEAGRRVLFTRCSDLVQRLQAARRYQAETSVLFEWIVERYERKRLASTANTPFSQWGEVFAEPAVRVVDSKHGPAPIGGGRHYKKMKRDGFLGELFDFD